MVFRLFANACVHDYEATGAPKHRGQPTLVCLKCGHTIDPLADEVADVAQWEPRRQERLRRQKAAAEMTR
jgi:hypothetical protein